MTKFYSPSNSCARSKNFELRQQGRRWLRKRHFKVHSRCFKIYRAYSISLTSSNVINFFLSYILKPASKFRKRKRKSLCCAVSPSYKRGSGHFRLLVVQWRQKKKIIKKRDARAKLWLHLLVFWGSRKRRRRLSLSSLMAERREENLIMTRSLQKGS